MNSLFLDYGVFNAKETVSFGRYPSKNDMIPIEWSILSIFDNKALLHSSKCFFSQPYDKKGTVNEWAKCSLRQYLNGEFYDMCFNSEEKKRIVTICTLVKGNDSIMDNVFLLTAENVNKYYAVDSSRVKPAMGFSSWTVGTDWWLRSAGADRNSVAFVTATGKICEDGIFSGKTGIAACPAIVVKLPRYPLL